MTRYLFDTNHLSPLVAIGHPLRQRLRDAQASGDEFAIATPALAEFLFGISLLPRAASNLSEWSRLRGDFEYYDVGVREAEMAASLQVSLRRRGWQLQTVDALIAAVGLHNDLTLLTTDQDFDEIAQLKRDNWLS